LTGAEIWKAFLDVIGFSARLAAIALVAGCALLLLPPAWLAQLSLDRVASDYRPAIAGVTLVAIAILVVDLARLVWRGLSKAARGASGVWRRRRSRAEIAARVAALNPAERAILREFRRRKERTVKMPVEDDGSVIMLMRDGILMNVASQGNVGMSGLMIPCAITDIAAPFVTDEAIHWHADIARAMRLQRPTWTAGGDGDEDDD
jgi:hypothetical protein